MRKKTLAQKSPTFKKEFSSELFLVMASHELKSLLTSIKAYSQLAQKNLIKTKENKAFNFLSRVDMQVNKLTSLIVDLLDIGKIRMGKLSLERSYFNLQKLIEDIIMDIKVTTKQRIIIEGYIKEEVYADKKRISQVLMNLISNAVRYAPNSKKIILHLKQNKKETVVGVQDFGPGIQNKDKKKIFEMYYQSKENNSSKDGMGLGLFIANAIVVTHRGSIKIKSNSKGTTFYFVLPTPTF